MELQGGNSGPAAAASQVHIVDAAQTLQIDWEDGHLTRLPWWYLRGFCPCASCQGHGGPYTFVTVADPPPRLCDVLEVGSYALNLTWDDKHRTGIYPFRLLRRLCACADCRAQAAGDHVARQLSDDLKARVAATAAH